jgi:hypothetical protein
LSWVAVPLFGPLLLPLALTWMLVAEHASLRAQRAPAWAALLLNALSWGLPFVLCRWR